MEQDQSRGKINRTVEHFPAFRSELSNFPVAAGQSHCQQDQEGYQPAQEKDPKQILCDFLEIGTIHQINEKMQQHIGEDSQSQDPFLRLKRTQNGEAWKDHPQWRNPEQ